MREGRSPAPLECISDPKRAGVMLDPLRVRLLELAQEPASASELAAKLGLPRQRVNYHVRQLAAAKFLRRAGDRRRRNMIERRWLATARSWCLDPGMLEGISADATQVRDRLSAGYLLAAASRLQQDVARASREAAEQEKTLPLMAVHAEVRFTSALQRRAFAEAVERALLDAIERHTSPAASPEGTPLPGRLYRVLFGCAPIPSHKHEDEETK